MIVVSKSNSEDSPIDQIGGHNREGTKKAY